MQQSMTGFGIHKHKSENFEVETEIKTLNSKFFDFILRAPQILMYKEADIRNMVLKKLKRGKIVLKINIENLDKINEVENTINQSLFYSYYQKFLHLSQSISDTPKSLFELALNAPGVVQLKSFDIDAVLWKHISESIEFSITQCLNFRKLEGEGLIEKIKTNIKEIEACLAKIEILDPIRLENYKKKIGDNLKLLTDKVEIDENRLSQEIIFYAEKIDINEEKIRLKRHIDYFLQVSKTESYAGKKLGFISQEIGREINTLGAKAYDSQIQQQVIIMKNELEQIKEQLNNIL